MDRQKAANLLQEQLQEVNNLQDLNPDNPDFELWKENCLTIFKEIFPDERRFINSFEWSSFRVNRIKFEEEVGYFTEEDKEAYIKGLQGAEVTMKAALKKLELFGFKPKVEKTSNFDSGMTVQIINNLSNKQVTQVVVNFEQILASINEINKTQEEKTEAKQYVKDLESEVKKENPSWDKIKTILVWLLNFSRDTFIQVLPYILQAFNKP